MKPIPKRERRICDRSRRIPVLISAKNDPKKRVNHLAWRPLFWICRFPCALSYQTSVFRDSIVQTAQPIGGIRLPLASHTNLVNARNVGRVRSCRFPVDTLQIRHSALSGKTENRGSNRIDGYGAPSAIASSLLGGCCIFRFQIFLSKCEPAVLVDCKVTFNGPTYVSPCSGDGE